MKLDISLFSKFLIVILIDSYAGASFFNGHADKDYYKIPALLAHTYLLYKTFEQQRVSKIKSE